MRSRTAWLVLGFMAIAALPACGGSSSPNAGGQTGTEGVGCLPTSTTPLALDDDSPIGFSGADVLAVAAGSKTAPLAWDKGGQTDLTVDVQHTGTDARFLDREWVDDGSGTEMATDCADIIELDVDVSFSTTDGAFAETWTSKLQAPIATSATLWQELDPAAVQGSYEVTEVNPADFDAVRLFVDIAIDDTGVHGSVNGQGEKVEGQGPDGVASAMAFPVATF